MKEFLLKLDNVRDDFEENNNEIVLEGAIMFDNKSIGTIRFT